LIFWRTWSAIPLFPPPKKPRADVVIVVSLILLVALYAIGNALHRHVINQEVTLAEMGIEDETKVTWTYEPDPFRNLVIFDVSTTNTSPHSRQVEFCARSMPGTFIDCITYKVAPHSTVKRTETLQASFAPDDNRAAAAESKVFKVDGHPVRG
jgi:hypothetical protein